VGWTAYQQFLTDDSHALGVDSVQWYAREIARGPPQDGAFEQAHSTRKPSLRLETVDRGLPETPNYLWPPATSARRVTHTFLDVEQSLKHE
jgi:hypothetical protein